MVISRHGQLVWRETGSKYFHVSWLSASMLFATQVRSDNLNVREMKEMQSSSSMPVKEIGGMPARRWKRLRDVLSGAYLI